MLKYSIKRIILALVTAFIILSLTYILVKSLGIQENFDPKSSARHAYYLEQWNLGYLIRSSVELDPAVYGSPIATFVNPDSTKDFFYERPVLEQYWQWLGNIVKHFDWGRSTIIEPGSLATSIIIERLPTSMILNIISVIVSVPLGIGLGILAGLKKNTWVDHLISTVVMIFISIPSFVVISFLIYFLAYKGNLLPPAWPTPSEPLSQKALALIIPVISLSFGSVCGYTRFVRAELCEVMSSEYLLLARTKGLTKNQAITRHALKNAFVPILPSILAEFIGIFGGSMILEKLYSIPGIGDLYIKSIEVKDYNVLMVDMAIFTTVGLLAGIVLDLSYGFIDPRIRMGEKR